MPLVRELDQLYYKLTSRDLRSLLETRSWSDYHQAIGWMVGRASLGHSYGMFAAASPDSQS